MQEILLETLSISNANLGPIKASKSFKVQIEIAPLTVFIGPQGVGKSLVSQLLYFMRNAPYLISNYAKGSNPQNAVREVVDGLRSGRSGGRDLATFVSTGTAQIHYGQKTRDSENASTSEIKRSISINGGSHKILPLKGFDVEVEAILSERFYKPSSQAKFTSNALFIPAERTFFSRFLNSDFRLLSNDSLPLTMIEFSDVLARGRDIFLTWQNNPSEIPSEFRDIEKLVRNSIRGRVRYEKAGPFSGTWQWVPENSENSIQIEMSSSGQMEAWPLIFAAETAFGLSEGERPLFLHIEEPEAHLHPAAQVAMVHLLAYMVNKGFRVLITTHSLTILYALNNLTAAYQALKGQTYNDVPSENIRIDPKNLCAYLFTGEKIEKIHYSTDELEQIDEGRLGEVLGNLQIEFNRIMSYLSYGKEAEDAGTDQI